MTTRVSAQEGSVLGTTTTRNCQTPRTDRLSEAYLVLVRTLFSEQQPHEEQPPRASSCSDDGREAKLDEALSLLRLSLEVPSNDVSRKDVAS
jgi:hypothetical protein